MVDTQSGGKHFYFRNPLKQHSKAGILRDMDCDVRGVGGQTVAPGAIREDGKTYTIANGASILDIMKVPPLPEQLVTAVQTHRPNKAVNNELIEAALLELQSVDVPTFADVFDPIMGYDLDQLRADNSEFNKLYTGSHRATRQRTDGRPPESFFTNTGLCRSSILRLSTLIFDRRRIRVTAKAPALTATKPRVCEASSSVEGRRRFSVS